MLYCAKKIIKINICKTNYFITSKNYNNSKKLLLLFNILLLILYNILINNIKKDDFYLFDSVSNKKDYIASKFIIIKRSCSICGLFSFFIVHLGCIHRYLLEGYIPIVDIKSIPTSINGYNTSKSNYWELFFEQPFGYNLDNVLKYAKNITYITIDDCVPRPDDMTMIYNYPSIQFWHNFARKFMSIKREIIDLSKKIMYKLFKNSKNILGVLARGTDYISIKPKGHPIPPNLMELIHDVKEMDNLYNYDYIFFSTEDEMIRDIFAKIFLNKVKQIRPRKKINYDYIKKDYLNNNELA